MTKKLILPAKMFVVFEEVNGKIKITECSLKYYSQSPDYGERNIREETQISLSSFEKEALIDIFITGAADKLSQYEGVPK